MAHPSLSRLAIAGLLRTLGRRRLWLAVGLLATLAACGGGSTSDPEAKADVQARARASVGAAAAVNVTTLSVNKLVLKAERRITRTVFEYDYQVEIKNNGGALTGVVVQLTAVGAGTSIVDGTVSVGALAAGATVTPVDIVRLRHDRSLPFQTGALIWQFSAAPGALVALPGNPSDQAVDAIGEYDADITFPTAELDFDISRGTTVVRSKLIFGFKSGATVGEVNALLQSMGATIVRTYAKTAVVEVRIPDPGSVQAMNAQLAALSGNPLVRYALPTAFVAPKALPAIYQSPTPPSLDIVAHHLAVKAGPAWNARRAVQLSSAPLGPVLMVVDFFGKQAPTTNLLNTSFIGSVGSGFTTSTPSDSHGYHVLGIAAASFNTTAELSDQNAVTGIYAAAKPLLLQVDDLSVDQQVCTFATPIPFLNLCKAKTAEDRMRTMVAAYEFVDRKLVLNTSIGYDNLTDSQAEGYKKYWLDLLRGKFGEQPAPIEAKFLHAAAAGNDYGISSRRNAGWTRAAIDGALTNTAVVENRSAGQAAPFAASILHASSSVDGNLSAVGSNTNAAHADQGVWSYGDNVGTNIDRVGCLDSNKQPTICPYLGTSMAAPQVAGLAAWFWAIRSDFSSSQLLDLLVANAIPTPQGGAPLIDAYATLLAADDSEALAGAMGSPLKAPVRLAILDVNEDNKFTLDDAKLFVAAMVANQGASAFSTATTSLTKVQTPTGEKKVDRSRFDLNGDGQVGGSGRARFNLDIDYASPRTSKYGEAAYKNAKLETVRYDEKSITDIQVLCYYVGSKLFSSVDGDQAAFEDHVSKAGLTCAETFSGPVTLSGTVGYSWSCLGSIVSAGTATLKTDGPTSTFRLHDGNFDYQFCNNTQKNNLGLTWAVQLNSAGGYEGMAYSEFTFAGGAGYNNYVVKLEKKTDAIGVHLVGVVTLTSHVDYFSPNPVGTFDVKAQGNVLIRPPK